VLLPLLLALAASFIFIGRNSHDAEASPFNPRLSTTLASSGAGATSDINQFANWGTAATDGNRSFPASSVYFTPGNWGIPNCAPSATCPYAFDQKTGDFSSTTTFGLLNSQCALAVPVGFPDGMRNASTDPSDTISPGAGFSNLIADVNPPNGIKDGVEHWNTLLNGLQSAGLLPATPPRERQILQTVLAGLGNTVVWVDVLTYDPGLLGGAASAPLGYASTFILENANPLQPPSPGLITDTCGLNNSITQSGLVAGNEYGAQCTNNVDDDGDGFVNDGCAQVGNTAESGPSCANNTDDDLDGSVNDGCPTMGPSGPAVHRSNPASPGTNLFFLNAGSARDADQGPSAPVEPTTFVLPGGLSGAGFVNNLDTCPFQPNVGGPIAPVGGTTTAGDAGESPGDGIDAVCDPNPTVSDGSDLDGDAYFNRGDNCPLVANGPFVGANNQQDLGEVSTGAPVDGGPASDGIGDLCDINPTVADGHFHSALRAAPVCVGLADSDGDGWCDLSEGGLGSNPASAASTPEALAVPGSCSDGADNDGDGSADLNDGAGGPAAPSGCQLPSHDLSIKKLNGSVAVPCAGGTVEYNLLLNNPGAADKAEASIYLDSRPSYIPPAGPNPAPGKTAGSVSNVSSGDIAANVTGSGPINIDGDADVEWLTKVTLNVKPSPATTTMTFSITYPAQASCSGAGTTDFMMTVDVCHGNDVAPLGVAPLNGNCAGSATSDGGQDRNSGNDIISKNIDAQ
jgi:hypothetical protein